MHDHVGIWENLLNLRFECLAEQQTLIEQLCVVGFEMGFHELYVLVHTVVVALN